MDRKFTDIEKKTKTTAARTGGGRVGAVNMNSSTTRQAASGGKGSTMTTPRGNSRAPAQQAPQEARQRSRTPVSKQMQNTLNTSMSSKGNRESLIGKQQNGASHAREASKGRS